MSKRVPVMLLIVLFGVLPALADQSAHVVVSPDTLKWAEPPILPGAKLAVVQGDPSKEGPFVYRLKMPAGYKVPPHFHRAAENVTVLTGVFYLGLGEKFDQGSGQELPVGGFVSVPPKHPHYAWAGPQETVVQVHGVGPTDLTFVNPADDPRKK
jgi:quercetin dioxygenase-like cupin family protein